MAYCKACNMGQATSVHGYCSYCAYVWEPVDKRREQMQKMAVKMGEAVRDVLEHEMLAASHTCSICHEPIVDGYCKCL